MLRLESRSGRNEEKFISSTNSRKDFLSVCFVPGTGAELDGKDTKVNLYITFLGILKGRQHVKITWANCCGNTKKTPGRGEAFRGMKRNPVPTFLNRAAACSVCFLVTLDRNDSSCQTVPITHSFNKLAI